MDTTKLEYELRCIKEKLTEVDVRLSLIEPDKAKPSSTSPAPKFWVRYVQSQHKENPDPVLFHDLQPFESRLKVYCHTREGLVEMIREYVAQQDQYLTDFIDSYLKSNGGV